MLRRFKAIALILAVLLLFAACSNASDNNSGSSVGNNNSSNSGSPNNNNSNSNNNSSAATGIDALELGKNGPVTIEFWHIQATIYGEAIKLIVDEFNKEYEGKIIVNEVCQGSYDDLNQKVKAAFQGGGLPDIAMCYENEIAEYMRANILVPLDDYIASSKYGMSETELSDMLPEILARQRLITYDGKTMSFPHGNSAQGVYFNVELLKEAGYDEPAKTWPEFEEQCMAIYEKTGVPALCTGANPAGNLSIWLRTYGITPLADDGSFVDYDNEYTVEILERMKRLIDSGAAYRSENTENDFCSGLAAMEIGTTARTTSKIEKIEDTFEWDIVLIPQGKAGEQNTALWGGNQVMFKSDPERQLAAWIFLKYFAGGHAQAIYGSLTGYFPATVSALNDPMIIADFAKYPQKQRAFDEILPYAKIESSSPARAQVSNAVNDQSDAFFADRRSAEETAALMQEEAELALEKYR